MEQSESQGSGSACKLSTLSISISQWFSSSGSQSERLISTIDILVLYETISPIVNFSKEVSSFCYVHMCSGNTSRSCRGLFNFRWFSHVWDINFLESLQALIVRTLDFVSFFPYCMFSSSFLRSQQATLSWLSSTLSWSLSACLAPHQPLFLVHCVLRALLFTWLSSRSPQYIV